MELMTLGVEEAGVPQDGVNGVAEEGSSPNVLHAGDDGEEEGHVVVEEGSRKEVGLHDAAVVAAVHHVGARSRSNAEAVGRNPMLGDNSRNVKAEEVL